MIVGAPAQDDMAAPVDGFNVQYFGRASAADLPLVQKYFSKFEVAEDSSAANIAAIYRIKPEVISRQANAAMAEFLIPCPYCVCFPSCFYRMDAKEVLNSMLYVFTKSTGTVYEFSDPWSLGNAEAGSPCCNGESVGLNLGEQPWDRMVLRSSGEDGFEEVNVVASSMAHGRCGIPAPCCGEPSAIELISPEIRNADAGLWIGQAKTGGLGIGIKSATRRHYLILSCADDEVEALKTLIEKVKEGRRE